MRTLTLAAALVVALACPTRAGQTTAGSSDPDPLAVVGGRVFTAREVDDRWKADSPLEQVQAKQALYEGRRAALDALVADFLLDRAAAAKGQSREAFEAAEVARRARPVTDSEVDAFYAENRSQTQGRSLQEMRPILREFLEEQRTATALAELIADLKTAEPALRVMLDAPRQPIEMGPDDPSEGPAGAPVTLVEFADFQCPFCQRLAPTLRDIREHYGDRVRIVWKDFPLTRIHPRAFRAAEAGNCAHEQGRFWLYHDRLFTSQQALDDVALKQYARESGLDAARFDACLDSSMFGQKVRDAISAAARHGVSATPATYINGRLISGAKPYEAFAAVIDEELERAKR